MVRIIEMSVFSVESTWWHFLHSTGKFNCNNPRHVPYAIIRRESWHGGIVMCVRNAVPIVGLFRFVHYRSWTTLQNITQKRANQNRISASTLDFHFASQKTVIYFRLPLKATSGIWKLLMSLFNTSFAVSKKKNNTKCSSVAGEVCLSG